MLRKVLVAAFVVFVGLAWDAYAQDARTQDLVSSLDKVKYKKKDKGSISIEVYVNIKNDVALRAPSEYSGNYTSEDAENNLMLKVDGTGFVTGSGVDYLNDRRLGFTLKDVSISGALLTGTKVYDNGDERKFEAVFVNRTVETGKNAGEITSRDTKFGLGFIQRNESASNNWVNRVFLERR